MKNIYTIACIELKRMSRNHVIWFICILSVFLLFLMDVFNYFTIEEQIKMIKDFSLGFAGIITLFLVIFYPSTLIKNEFLEKTIYTLLASPLTRKQLILGKSLSMVFLLSFTLFLNTVALFLMLLVKGGDFNSQIIIGVLMLLLKNLTLMGFAFLFSVLPVSNVIGSILTLFIFSLGSVKTYFLLTLSQDLPEYIKIFQKLIFTCVPNFRIFDVVENITLGKVVTTTHLYNSFLHFLGISLIIYGITFLIFDRKEL